MKIGKLNTVISLSAEKAPLSMIYACGVVSTGFFYHRKPSPAIFHSDYIETNQLAEVECYTLSIDTKITLLFIIPVRAMLNRQHVTSCVDSSAINLSKALR